MEGKGRMTVPTFGEWDMDDDVPDYSMDFARIREMRRQNRSRGSVGYEEDLLPQHDSAKTGEDSKKCHRKKEEEEEEEDNRKKEEEEEDGRRRRPIHLHQQHPPAERKRLKDYFQCCLGAPA